MATSKTDQMTACTDPPGEGPAVKESQILDGAASVFARDGYEGASMSRIAAEAGVSKGTLYNYFAGKAELFCAYVHRECDRWFAIVFEELDMSASPREVLPEMGRRVFRMMMSEQALQIFRMVIAEAEKFPELARSFYAAGPVRAIGHVSAYLDRATRDGWLRVEDPQIAAEQFFALMTGKLCMQRRLHLIAMPTEAEIDHEVGNSVRMFLESYWMAGR